MDNFFVVATTGVFVAATVHLFTAKVTSSVTSSPEVTTTKRNVFAKVFATLLYCVRSFFKAVSCLARTGAIRPFNGNTGGKMNFLEKSTPFPTPARPKHKLLGIFLGHFADLEPWTKNFSARMIEIMLNKREDWYDEAKSKTMCVRLAIKPTVYTYDLDLITKIVELSDESSGKKVDVFRKNTSTQKGWSSLFPHTLNAIEGKRWEALRQINCMVGHKIYSNDRIPQNTHKICKNCLDLTVSSQNANLPIAVNLWKTFAPMFFDAFHTFTYGVNTELVAGKNMNMLDDYMLVGKTLGERMMFAVPFLWKLPTKDNKTVNNTIKRVRDFINEQMKDCENKEDGTFIKLMSKYRNQMSDEEFRDQLATVVYGGLETTINLTHFCLHYIADSPKWQEKLYEEVKDVDFERITGRELESLRVLKAIINETSRMRAVTPSMTRVPTKDITVNGYLFKKGTVVNIDHDKMGRIPEYWNGATDLDEFNPGRWLEDGFEPPEWAFVPFGLSERKCTGDTLAINQIQIVLATIVQNFILSETEDQQKLEPKQYRFGHRKVVPDERSEEERDMDEVVFTLGRGYAHTKEIMFQQRP